MARKSTGTSNAPSSSLNARPAQVAPSSSYQGAPRTTVGTPQPVKPAAKASAPPMQPKAIALPALSHEQVAKRAKAIWEKKGRPSGQDEQNWLQAESELRSELQA